ncbi:MAG: hypothetical protein JXR10_06725 [Cyclobacteriaceae bacterium]
MKTDIITTACNQLSKQEDTLPVLQSYLSIFGQLPEKLSEFPIYQESIRLINTNAFEEVIGLKGEELEAVHTLILTGFLKVTRSEGSLVLLVSIGNTVFRFREVIQDENVWVEIVRLLMVMSIDISTDTDKNDSVKCAMFISENLNLWSRNNQLIIEAAILKLYAQGSSIEQISEYLGQSKERVGYMLSFSKNHQKYLDDYMWFTDHIAQSISLNLAIKRPSNNLFAGLLSGILGCVSRREHLEDVLQKSLSFSMN